MSSWLDCTCGKVPWFGLVGKKPSFGLQKFALLDVISLSAGLHSGRSVIIWIKVGSSCKETAAWKGLHMRKSFLLPFFAIFSFMLVAIEIWDGRQGISN